MPYRPLVYLQPIMFVLQQCFKPMNVSKIMILGIFSALFGSACSSQGVESISANELQENLDNGVLLDVRTGSEVSQGYIDAPEIEFADVNKVDFKSKIASLDKEATYYVYCRSGARSSKASKIMADLGFTNVYNVKGGIMSWRGPVKKP